MTHPGTRDEHGKSLSSFIVDNSSAGAETMVSKIFKMANKLSAKSICAGMEATSNLGWHLAHYLQDKLCNHSPGNINAKVYVLNARKVTRFKKGYDPLPKNDRIDAWVIADHLRFGRLPR
ncbi:MAG: IS110 family transposase [Desulfotomaculum sp.]|nr:IS110 family transposase [Desulfotomaculum sp.]